MENIGKQSVEIQQAISDFVQTYLSLHANMKEERVLRIADDATIRRLRDLKIPETGRPVQDVWREMVEQVYSNQLLMQHPRCFAFIPAPVSLLSWLGGLMTDAYDTHGGSWLQASAASCIEQEVIRFMCSRVGYPASGNGVFVSGGSMANLTALVAARHALLKESDYGRGIAYLSAQTHNSVAKGLRIIGFRADQIRKIPTGPDFRMDMRELEKAVQADLAAGHIPFAVTASAGTTNTGSVDPLNEIADLCEKYHLWMHVDGAYGASVVLSHAHRHLLNGIERADSISWDSHKWLMQTYSCSTVLVKDGRNLVDCFSIHPEYVQDAVTLDDQVNYWDFGVEMTRPARSLKLWFTLQVLGTDEIGNMIDHGFQLAEWAEDEVRKHQDWEIVSSAQLAIVNIRYAPAGLTAEQCDRLNQRISQKVVEDGYACILTTELMGKKVLRICALHPETTEADMREVIQYLDCIARELRSEQ